MSDIGHEARLRDGPQEWNAWRAANPDIVPDLRGARLGHEGSGSIQRLDLRGVDFTGALLKGANLHSATMGFAKCRRADLSGADLEHVDLRGSDLSRADLRDARLMGADLRDVNFSEADLTRANLSGANLYGVDLSSAGLSQVVLSGATLVGSNLAGCYLLLANLNGADLRNADLSGTVLSGADLFRANLTGARLRGARLDDRDDRGFTGRATTLERARLVGTDLAHADLCGANLRHADLADALLECANLERARLEGTSLKGANLDYARLDRALLIHADLTGSSMRSTSVYGVGAWDVSGTPVESSLSIAPPGGGAALVVGDLEVAQFLYFLLSNRRIRDVLDTVRSSVVLLLGRFNEKGTGLLEVARNELAAAGYVPVIFDFSSPATMDMTGTVETLARLSRFVVADVSDPSSVPHELATVVPYLRKTPVGLIREAGSTGYTMAADLEAYPWVLPLSEYPQEGDLAPWIARLLPPLEEKVNALLGGEL